MHHLAGGMYATVGSSGAVEGDGRGSDLGQRVFQGLLNGAYSGLLALPAPIASAFVLDTERDTLRRDDDRGVKKIQDDGQAKKRGGSL